ncbi:MAG: L-glyceraldehyde 3-phosphate reductase [Ferruginibacter sp.]
MNYTPDSKRYEVMQYRRCGNSGLLLPALSLGLWHNFGTVDNSENGKQILFTAFDNGITHFDLANNYGPPPGSAEENFGHIMKQSFSGNLRDELIISSKAGYNMWPGPYGEWGSRKYLMSSLNQSLKRMQLDYVDIFYHHRPDPQTPIEETMLALHDIVKSGKALYAGISNYDAGETKKAIETLKNLGTHCLIHQPKYSMFDRWVEDGLLAVLEDTGTGCIPFSPLAQGMLTDKYLKGVPSDSRVSKGVGFLTQNHLTQEQLQRVKQLNEMAVERGQTLAQMALAWILKDSRITTVLIGASKPEQVTDSIKCLQNPAFTTEELSNIDLILK